MIDHFRVKLEILLEGFVVSFLQNMKIVSTFFFFTCFFIFRTEQLIKVKRSHDRVTEIGDVIDYLF